MAKIKKIKGRQVFDSRGNPTVEAEVYSDKGNHALAIIPLALQQVPMKLLN